MRTESGHGLCVPGHGLRAAGQELRVSGYWLRAAGCQAAKASGFFGPRPVARGPILAALLVLAASTGCGYSLAGRGSFLPAYIQTIGIPNFNNATVFYNVDQIVTQKVRSEFIGRGKYKVLPETTGVDAVLTGDIVSISVAPASFNADQQASRYFITLSAKIEFRDLRANKVIWQNPAMSFREEYQVTTATSATDVNAFFGQETNALERVATDFARTLVSAILEAF